MWYWKELRVTLLTQIWDQSQNYYPQDGWLPIFLTPKMLNANVTNHGRDSSQ